MYSPLPARATLSVDDGGGSGSGASDAGGCAELGLGLGSAGGCVHCPQRRAGPNGGEHHLQRPEKRLQNPSMKQQPENIEESLTLSTFCEARVIPLYETLKEAHF